MALTWRRGLIERGRGAKPSGVRDWASLALALLALALPAPTTARAQSGVSVVIHSAETSYDPLEDGYVVTAYLSVLDAQGEPVPGLGPGDLVVREDGNEVPEFELAASSEGLGLVLAIDTSGSMAAAGKIRAVQQAVGAFIEGMGEADQVGLLSFNESPKLEIGITSDRSGVRNFAELLQPVQNAATCLWDAAYEAVEVASSVQHGRRAAVLLTDGIDERISGEPCSTKTLEDVVAFANDPMAGVPIYTVGVGTRVNAQDLARLSDLTGGRSLLAVDAGGVGDVFTDLGMQLQRGYVLRYLSRSASGEHGLFVQVDYQGARDQQTRSFRAMELPGRASFANLEDQGPVSAGQRFSLTVSGEGQPTRAEFYLGREQIGEDGQPPFAVEWPAGAAEPGPYQLRGVAYGADGAVLAVARVEVRYQPVEAPPPPGDAAEVPEALAEAVAAQPPSLVLVVGLPLVALAVIVGGLLVRRSRGRRPVGEPGQAVARDGAPSGVEPAAAAARPVGADTLATLTVESCQDPDMVGQRFEIWERQVSIGRSPECDLVIPLQPVSRIHAVIRLGDPSLTMDEIAFEPAALGAPPPFRILDGDPQLGKPSTYGTHVDEVRVPPAEGLYLQDGCRIRLGRSIAEGRIPPVVLTFRDLREAAAEMPEADLTSDALVLPDATRPANDYATEEFAIDQPLEDEFKTEAFGPEDDEYKTEEFGTDEPGDPA